MNPRPPFADALARATLEKRSAVCVGLDPRWEQLPESIRKGGDPLAQTAVASATGKFCCEVIDAVREVAPIIKPQAAFFEALGPAGLEVLANVIEHAQHRGLLVLLDAKRGDIGSTAEAYASAYLGADSPWHCDALTVNPFLGSDTLQPFVETAQAQAAGIFVLVKTSNPGSGFIQDLTSDGTPTYRHVADTVQGLAKDTQAECGYGCVGAVVGATYPEQLAELRQAMPNAWLLIPGYGAQGGSASGVRHGFDANGSGAIVNSSRGIIFAFRQANSVATDWQQAVHQAACRMRDELPQPTAK